MSAVLLLGSTACETRNAAVALHEVVGPTGGDALTILAVDDRVLIPTDLGVFVSTPAEWVQQPGRGLGSRDPAASISGFLRGGLQLNYPNSSLIAAHEGAVWLVSRVDDEPALLWSDDHGERWRVVPMPSDAEDDEEVDISPAVQTAELPRFVNGRGTFYLVGTSNVWQFEGNPEEPDWKSIGLDGLPMAAEGLPPSIRNYLPRSPARGFEMMTVLSDQLLVFRRSDPQDPWVMTATMATVDRTLMGPTTSDAVYLVSSDAIQRTEDQGESWFRFWPDDHPQIEAVALVVRRTSEFGHDIVVGAIDGSIYRSTNGGTSWTMTRSPDEDGRAITGIEEHDGALWATTQGQGVLFSADWGQTWSPRNQGLRAARPLDIAFSSSGDVMLASRAGLVQHSGQHDSGNWSVVTERATSAVGVDALGNRTVWGTIHGELASLELADADRDEAPFATSPSFEFAPHHLPRRTLPPEAVVAVSARDDGRRWVAWTQARGAAFSNDAGATWEPLPLSDGLQAALASTTVREVVVEANDTIYLLEENRDVRTPALLWRSEDDGKSWTTVQAFPRDGASRVLLRARPPNYPGVLYIANGDTLSKSVTSGESWTSIEGPWRGSRIIGLALEEQRAALLIDARKRLEIIVIEGLDAPNPIIARHMVVPTGGAHMDPNDIRRFELSDRAVLIAGKRRIWMGKLPPAQRALGDGLAFATTFAGAVALIAIAFAFIRSSALQTGRR